MFTGIVQAVGQVVATQAREGGVRLTLETGTLDLGDVAPGDSIAVNGVCLTAVVIRGKHVDVDVSAETLRCTRGFALAEAINLEKALRPIDRLGGHLVSGHVDGVGCVALFAAAGESWLLEIDAPPALARYIATKGSITVNGVSLTVNRVAGLRFAVNLIPHTLQVTTLHTLQAGTIVNLEIDLIARYVERLTQFDAAFPAQ
jgi:riboflavin synthase